MNEQKKIPLKESFAVNQAVELKKSFSVDQALELGPMRAQHSLSTDMALDKRKPAPKSR
jgi:hypothetical protein